MKKVLLILLILYQTIMVVSCDKQEEISDKSEVIIEELSIPDRKIKIITSSDEYIKGDIKTRARLLLPIMDELLKEGYIIEYKYNVTGPNPQISLKYTAGGKCGIFLEDFPESLN